MKKHIFICIIFLSVFVSCVSLNKTVFKTSRDTKIRGVNYPVIHGNGIVFKVHAPEALFVTIAGQFNGWNPQATPMEKKDDGNWEISLELTKGQRHRYKYIIDGIWIPDPDNPDSEPDGFGGLNSLVKIPKEGDKK